MPLVASEERVTGLHALYFELICTTEQLQPKANYIIFVMDISLKIFESYSRKMILSTSFLFMLQVLFVSPERFLNAEFISIFYGSSVLSTVVVDEAHCVSEW